MASIVPGFEITGGGGSEETTYHPVGSDPAAIRLVHFRGWDRAPKGRPQVLEVAEDFRLFWNLYEDRSSRTFVIDNEVKECRLYLDADRKKTIPFKGEPRLMRPGQTMTIGNTGTNEFMDGVLDDVRIWKHALTDEQVPKLVAH